ncbi:hypothetical protein GCM10009682_05230 [Luedemannella flava]|uniref:Uncharacterized protein n=1 Tax=Luedemannella flava TaxID=349316 RepID=A0ABP4XRV6_9ACTN
MQMFVGGALLAVFFGMIVGSSFTRAKRARKDYVAGVKAVPTLRRTQFKELRRAGKFGILAAGVVLALVFAAIRWDEK